MSNQQKPPIVNVQKSPDYRIIFVSGVYGGSNLGYIEAMLYTDKISSETKSIVDGRQGQVVVDKEIQCTLMIPIVVAKQFSSWLDNHVKSYERAFGEVKTPPPQVMSLLSVGSEEAQDVVKAISQLRSEMKKELDKINEKINKIEGGGEE